MNSKLATATLALTALASLALTGCLTKAERSGYSSDGQSAFLVSEVDQMGQALDAMPSAALGKTAADAADTITITGELVIDPFTYKEECHCWVRRAKYTGSRGYERERIDTVTLLDANNAPMSVFLRDQVVKIIHSRNVTHTLGAREVNTRIDMTVDIKTDNGVKVGVWNGTMNGTFNGQEFKNGTVTNVTRPIANGRFQFPTSGTVEIKRPVYLFLVEFLGGNKAKITITNRLNGRIHIIFVEKNYAESDPQDQ